METEQIKSTWFIHDGRCPNCQGTNLIRYTVGRYELGLIEGDPDVLELCKDCGTLLGSQYGESDRRVWLEATGNPDSAGCPVCGV